MLDAAQGLGIQGIEVNSGNWSSAPHLALDDLMARPEARQTFKDAFADRGLELIALNANGNQLHPTDGERPIPRSSTTRFASPACSASARFA